MTLEARISADLKEAMRAGDAVTRDTLRMVLAGLKNRRIELGRDLEEADVLGVLRKAVKTRADSAEQYQRAGRADLMERERAEIEVVRRYLPAELSEEDVRAVVERTIAEVGASSRADLGKVMKAVMAAHKGSVDGKLVQRLAADMLG